MASVRTDFVIEAKAKGFSSTQKEMANLNKENKKALQEQLKGTKASDAEVKKLQTTLKGLAETQTALLKVMAKTGDKGSKSFKQLEKELQGVEKDSTRVTKAIKAMERALGDVGGKTKQLKQMMAQGSFTQGLAQGAIPGGAFIQRGPGVGRQMAGMAVGRAARGVAGAALGSPFGGIQSIAKGLMSVPGGGAIAAPMMQAAGAAGGALGFQRQLVAQSPFLGGAALSIGRAGKGAAQVDVKEAGRRALAKAMEGKNLTDIQKAANPELVNIQTKTLQRRMLKSEGLPENAPGFMGFGGEDIVTRGRRKSIGETAREQAVRDVTRFQKQDAIKRLTGNAQGRAEEAAIAENAKARAKARRFAERKAYGPLLGAGKSLGAFSKAEALQFGGQLGQVGGGTIQDINSQFANAAVSAKTLYGVGAGTSGSFLRAQRRGGLRGEQGGSAITGALKDAIELGLSGSEITDYMQQVAEGINQFKNTGIPLDKEAMQGFKAGAANLGLGVERGGVVGSQLQQSMQKLSKQGAQNAFDMLILTKVGKPKDMTSKSLLEAKARLNDKGAPEKIAKLMASQFMQAGGSEGGGFGVLSSFLKSQGITLAPRELLNMGKQIESGKLPTEALTKAQNKGAGPKSTKDLAASAKSYIDAMGPNLRKQSDIADKQLSVGQKMLTAVQNFEDAQVKVTEQFTKIAAGPLTTISEGAQALASSLPAVIDGFKSLGSFFSSSSDFSQGGAR